MDRNVYKEMNEPLLFDEGDIWFVLDGGFACVNSCKLKYLYTEPRYRNIGIATSLLQIIDGYGFNKLTAVTPVRNKQFYINRGWVIEKTFINYLKITKHYGFIQ